MSHNATIRTDVWLGLEASLSAIGKAYGAGGLIITAAHDSNDTGLQSSDLLAAKWCFMREPMDWDARSDDEFREGIRGFLTARYPEEHRYISNRLRGEAARDWWAALVEVGLIAPGWSKKIGGTGLSPMKQVLLIEEFERYGVARLPHHGIVQVGPIIAKFGTDDQRHRYLEATRLGQFIWCQGYSEPESGSDLASLQTEARLDGEEFVINGSKIWTSAAMDATHMYLLARTAKGGRKQEGISFLLLDMSSPGIRIRPIRNLSGHEEFAQVFFDQVRTSKHNLVGDLHQGWKIAKALLGFERLSVSNPGRPTYVLSCLEKVAVARGKFKDAAFADRFAGLKMDLLDLTSLYMKYVSMLRDGREIPDSVSMLKVFSMELWQRLSEFLLEAADEEGAQIGHLLYGNHRVDVVSPFYLSRPGTIFGGTSEIQRNILSKAVLGLPQ